MKNILLNIGYFFKEAKTMIKLNLISNILSVFSTSLIFFIFAMIISGWWMSSQVVETIKGEAEINVYYGENIDSSEITQLVNKVKAIEGVREVRVVDEIEAYDRMVEILGKEARVLEFFDDNPFNPFVEVKINLEEIDQILDELGRIAEIDHIRDNREVLDRIHNVAEILKLLGYLVIIAIGISTLVIISHIIRMGIYNNREQINTLRLLGAPEIFIALPFVMEGLLLTLGGGIIASVMATLSLKYAYGQMTGPLPFIPLPPLGELTYGMFIIVISLSTVLGILGSLMGLSSAKNS